MMKNWSFWKVSRTHDMQIEHDILFKWHAACAAFRDVECSLFSCACHASTFKRMNMREGKGLNLLLVEEINMLRCTNMQYWSQLLFWENSQLSTDLLWNTNAMTSPFFGKHCIRVYTETITLLFTKACVFGPAKRCSGVVKQPNT